MKKLLILLAVVLTANVMMAQKMDRTNAYNYHRNGQYEKAIESIEKCVNHKDFLGMKSKDQAQAWLYRGMIYLDVVNKKPELLEKYPDALDMAFESLQKCIQTDEGYAKDNADQVFSRINIIKDIYAVNGSKSYEEMNFEQAAVNFRKSYDISLTSAFPDTLSLRSCCYSQLYAKKYEEAVVSYNELKDLGYGNPDVYYGLITCYNALNNNEMAMKTIQEGIEKYPNDSEMIIAKVNMFFELGRQEEAIADLNKLHEMNPDNISVLFVLGNIFGDDTKDIFDADKAIGYYTHILELDPSNDDSRTNLAALYLKLCYKKQAEANELGMSKEEQKKYETLQAESKELLNTGLPYAEQLYQNDKSEENKRLLKIYYTQLGKYEESKALDQE